MNGWLSKKSDYSVSKGIWGYSPTENVCKFSLLNIKFGNIFD